MAEDFNTVLDNVWDATVGVFDVMGYKEGKDIIVQFSSQGKISKNTPYCIISVLEIVQNGGNNMSSYIPREVESDVDEFTTHYTLKVQYSIIGTSAVTIAPMFRHQLSQSQNSIYQFGKNGLGVLNKTSLRYIPQKWESDWVDAYNFDVNLTFAINTKQYFDWVDRVVLDIDGHKTYITYKEE